MSPRRPATSRLTYADAGVDIAAGEKAVELIKGHVRSTFRAGVVGDVGGFGGLFDLARLQYQDPVLVSSTDGVGTKAVLAHQLGRYSTTSPRTAPSHSSSSTTSPWASSSPSRSTTSSPVSPAAVETPAARCSAVRCPNTLA